MDTPSDASHPTEAMAAWQDRISRTNGTRGKSRRCVHGGGKLPPSVAEQWTGAECGSRYKLGRSTENPETLLTSTSRTAGCGPACPVVWQGRAGDCSPYADRAPVFPPWALLLHRRSDYARPPDGLVSSNSLRILIEQFEAANRSKGQSPVGRFRS